MTSANFEVDMANLPLRFVITLIADLTNATPEVRLPQIWLTTNSSCNSFLSQARRRFTAGADHVSALARIPPLCKRSILGWDQS